MKNGTFDYILLLEEIQILAIDVPQREREKQISQFVFSVGSNMYSARDPFFDYVQQLRVHDLSVSFRGAVCSHLPVFGDFDPNCSACRLR